MFRNLTVNVAANVRHVMVLLKSRVYLVSPSWIEHVLALLVPNFACNLAPIPCPSQSLLDFLFVLSVPPDCLSQDGELTLAPLAFPRLQSLSLPPRLNDPVVV